MEVRDPGAMRALAHPLRFALMEVLNQEGEATATRCAELLDESPSNLSFHLRTLAKHGYIEEVPGAKGRQRPWRLVDREQRIEAGDTPESKQAAGAFAEFFLDKETSRLRAWIRESGHEPAWQKAAGMSGVTAWATRKEIAALNEELLAVMRRFDDRMADPALRPRGSRPVRLFLGISAGNPWDKGAR